MLFCFGKKSPRQLVWFAPSESLATVTSTKMFVEMLHRNVKGTEYQTVVGECLEFMGNTECYTRASVQELDDMGGNQNIGSGQFIDSCEQREHLACGALGYQETVYKSFWIWD